MKVLVPVLAGLPEVAFTTFCAQRLPILQPEPIHKVGKRVFRYSWVCQPDTPPMLAFQLGFYERIDFTGGDSSGVRRPGGGGVAFCHGRIVFA